mmetsp:Transcript_55096/g.98305  ORF Transcript_55096/g.98305 Transcript_55096/m.98305 type:complete len:679 (+) Transcript_55096:45-2081(+)
MKSFNEKQRRRQKAASRGVAQRELGPVDEDKGYSVALEPQEPGPFARASALRTTGAKQERSEDEEYFVMNDSIRAKLGFSGSSKSAQRQKAFPLSLPIREPSRGAEMPHLVKQLAEFSLQTDGSATLDCKGLRSLDASFLEKGFKTCQLNEGCRELPHHETHESMQLAVDATAYAKPTFLDEPVVMATRGCFTALAETLLSSMSRPSLRVFRVGDALILSVDPSDDSNKIPDEVAYRGKRFAALCTGDTLPIDGLCPSYQQVLEFSLEEKHKLLVIAGSDARDHGMPEVLVELKLMKHPKHRVRQSDVRFNMLRTWLQACFSMHEYFLIGLHDECQVEGFMKSSSRTQFGDYVNLLDIGQMLDNAGTQRDAHLWDPKKIFGWLCAVLDFLKSNTQPDHAYALHRPLAPDGKHGAGFLSLDECPQFWAACPDVFSHVLSGTSACCKDPVMERVRAFLRMPTSVHIIWPKLQDAPRVQPANHEIVLLDFSRNPKIFQEALHGCPELQACTQCLETASLPSQLESGARIFVGPGIFHAALDAIAREGWDLQKRHVVVAQEFEDVVMLAIAKLPSRAQVRLKGRQTAATLHGAAETAAGSSQGDQNQEPAGTSGDAEPQHARTQRNDTQDDEQVEEMYPRLVKRTFIHIPVESSMCSGPSLGAKTASTSDANPRVTVHPRMF